MAVSGGFPYSPFPIPYSPRTLSEQNHAKLSELL